MAICFGLRDMGSGSLRNGPAWSAVREGWFGADIVAVEVAGEIGEAGHADRVGAAALAMGEDPEVLRGCGARLVALDEARLPEMRQLMLGE